MNSLNTVPKRVIVSGKNGYRIVGSTAFLALTNCWGEVAAETAIPATQLERILKFGRWTLDRQPHCCYAYNLRGGVKTYLHRLILGDKVANAVVDHRDRNGLNNRLENLNITDAAGNANNRITNMVINAFGQSMTLTQWGSHPLAAVKAEAISKRLRRGWDAESAIVTPTRCQPDPGRNETVRGIMACENSGVLEGLK